MKLIINSKIYDIITETNEFTYLSKAKSGNNYKPVAGSEISSIGTNSDGDEYGDNSPTTDDIADMLTPQSYLRLHGMIANKYRTNNNINEESDGNIDGDLKNRLNHMIQLINSRFRDSKSKANVINYIISNLDITNLSGEDKNNIRNTIMK